MLDQVLDCTLDPKDNTYKISHPMTIHQKPFKGAVFLQGSCFYTNVKSMWKGMGYELTDSPDLADIICWLGGGDINPRLYGEKNVASYGISEAHDADDLSMLHEAGNRFKVGICRGAQLLNCIPNGGKLWQNIKGHTNVHNVTDVITGHKYVTNSIHHQQMRPGPDAEIVAYTNCSVKKQAEKETWDNTTGDVKEKDIEALWYPKTKSLLVQWHPELTGQQSTEYFANLMERYYLAA